MKRTGLLLLTVGIGLVAVAPASSRSSGKLFLLAGGRAGTLAIGMTAEEVEAAFGKAATRRIDLKLEGMPSLAIEIRLGKRTKPSLVAELEGGKVYRVGVRDERFKSKEGIGVGSTLGDIRKVYAVSGIDVGEGPGNLFAIVNEVGMSFRLDPEPPGAWYKTKDQHLIPDLSKVVEILVLRPAAR